MVIKKIEVIMELLAVDDCPWNCFVHIKSSKSESGRLEADKCFSMIKYHLKAYSFLDNKAYESDSEDNDDVDIDGLAAELMEH